MFKTISPKLITLALLAISLSACGMADFSARIIDSTQSVLQTQKGGYNGASKPVGDVKSTSDLYERPEPVEMAGYSGIAMEPCISLDGQYLFFNNSNDDNVATQIHFARRLSVNQFQYQGILPGASSKKKDMAPSIDRDNQVFFTSLRSFDADHKSIFVGMFDGSEVKDVSAIGGTISPNDAFWINMDSCISPNGDFLFVSRAQFLPFSKVPNQSDLLVSTRAKDGQFQLDENLQSNLKSINSSALEYAPAITADLLELYFTRCYMENGQFCSCEIMVARRKSVNQPFGLPERLSAINGFVEAPSLTLDKHELFYHKKVDNAYKIFRVTRKH